MALNKPTFMVSLYNQPGYGEYSASKAVDGNADPVALKPDNSCSITEIETNPWWAVDLGAAFAVVAVLFTNRANYGTVTYFLQCRLHQGHREFPIGNYREFPGIRRPSNSWREFPRMFKISQNCHFFTARRNAHIASAVLATAIPSVCLSVHPSVTHRYCVKTTAHSTVQFALSDSKMCLVL